MNLKCESTQIPSDFLFYESSDGRSRIEVRIKGETVWLSLTQMTDLFGRDKSVISRHIANIFEEGELIPGVVVTDFATTAADGKTYFAELQAMNRKPRQLCSREVESRSRFASTSGRLFTVGDGNRAVVGLRGMMVCGYGRPWISIHGCGGATMGQPRGSQSRGRFPRRRERLAHRRAQAESREMTG